MPKKPSSKPAAKAAGKPSPRKATKPPTFIVTGAAGFIGSNLAAELARRYPGASLHVVDDHRSGSFANLVEAFERRSLAPFEGAYIARSIADLDWHGMVEDLRPAAVFHLAAITDTTVMDENEMIRVNCEHAMPIFGACAELRVPLVYASSAATYGSPPQGNTREPFPESASGVPNNVYGFSKWLLEGVHRSMASARGLRAVGLRYFNVFGPGESRKGKMASMAYQLAQQMLAGKNPRLFADGSQSRDQVSVHDVVDCTIAAAGLDRDITPGVYNLGSGVATPFSLVASAVREGLGFSEADRPIEYFDMPPAIRAFYQDFTQADMAAARSGLRWAPSHSPADALRDYGRWLAIRSAR
ncbi:MAG: NAD-dependent epimerase/dehydratase family protein [Planctomycetota bacterium]|nr:NAD-dependent epimerase/dehydratase family protein [Planctomycetota bacterium]